MATVFIVKFEFQKGHQAPLSLVLFPPKVQELLLMVSRNIICEHYSVFTLFHAAHKA